MATKESREKVAAGIIDDLGKTTDPARVAAILARAKDSGINQRTVHSMVGQDVLGDRQFHTSTGRFRARLETRDEVLAVAPSTDAASLAVYGIAYLMNRPEYTTQTDRRLGSHHYPDRNPLLENQVRRTLGGAASPEKRAQVVYAAVSCSRALLHCAGVGEWQPVDAPPTSAVRKSVDVFKQPVRSTAQPRFHESLPPRWWYVGSEGDAGMPAPLALRTETLLDTTHPAELLLYSDREYGRYKAGREMVRRSFKVERHSYWVTAPDLGLLAPVGDREPGSLYPSLAQGAIDELTTLGKEGDPGTYELARPVADLVLVHHTLLGA